MNTIKSMKNICMATIKVICKHCGKPFDWNDKWPDGLKKCPYCGKAN